MYFIYLILISLSIVKDSVTQCPFAFCANNVNTEYIYSDGKKRTRTILITTSYHLVQTRFATYSELTSHNIIQQMLYYTTIYYSTTQEKVDLIE